MATALNIKPYMGATPEGTIIQLGQARGIKKALSKMVDTFLAELVQPEEKLIAISHCNAYERALSVKKMIEERVHAKEIIILDTNGISSTYASDGGIIIVGNSTNPTRFQHPVAGTYKKERVLAGKPYFSVASGGGTGRTLHPDNMAAGPASYGMTDTLGRMHSDAQFAGSSSVPAHVEMMGFLGIGNNPMVGCTVACAVNVALALNK